MRLLLFSTIIVSMTFPLSAQNAGRGGAPAPPAMTLTIPGFPDGGQIPVKFSQAAPGVAVGEGTSPAMSWANVPDGTQSTTWISPATKLLTIRRTGYFGIFRRPRPDCPKAYPR